MTMSRRYHLSARLMNVGGVGKKILNKDLPVFIEKTKEEGIPIVGIPGIELGELKPFQDVYLVIREDERERAAMEEEQKKYHEMQFNCSFFISQMWSNKLWEEINRITRYEERKKAVEEAFDKGDKCGAYMQVEFTAYDFKKIAFSIGYVMGQLYNVRDRKYYNPIKKFVMKNLLASLPYLPRERKANKAA